MSDILWCDEGNHPFSSNDPHRERYTKQIGGNPPQYTQDVRNYDICGQCVAEREARKRNILAFPKDSSADSHSDSGL